MKTTLPSGLKILAATPIGASATLVIVIPVIVIWESLFTTTFLWS